jgi:methionyl-tRNA formyltransferase
MTEAKTKIIFFGTPDFAVPFLKILINGEFEPVLVVTQPDKPVGRKGQVNAPPIKQLALVNNIAIAQPKNKSELIQLINDNEPDLCILVAYGMIIPKDFLNKPKFGWLNVHPSLLPKYRGPSPVQTALLKGETQTGVSIIKLTNQVDAGPIVAQRPVDINHQDNALTLSQKLAAVGADLLNRILSDYLAGTIKAAKQNEAEATDTKIIERDDGQIDWQYPVQEIIQRFSAFYPWPGIFTYLASKRLKIVNLSVLEGVFSPNLLPGEVFWGPSGELAVKCGQGAVELITVQLEGKKELPAKEFLRGQNDLIGKILK